MLTVSECRGRNQAWDDYVNRQPQATVYHQWGWQPVIAGTFGHQGYYLMALDQENVRGILPLFLMKSRIFGRYLISLPFISSAGLVADEQAAADALIARALQLSQEHDVDFLELRNNRQSDHHSLVTLDHKVDLVLPLTADPQFIWQKTLHENVRNKVRKARKNQLTVEMGQDPVFIQEFYRIFSQNMRDLGTPVYPQKFLLNILREFPEQVKIFLVRYRNKVIGGKLVLLYKDTMYYLYHSSLRAYAAYAPNNLLYWSGIEYAATHGYQYCNMGRSTVDSGAFNFKKQFGGNFSPLYWQYFLNRAQNPPGLNPANPKFSWAIAMWKKLPLFLTRLMGPLIVRHIP